MAAARGQLPGLIVVTPEAPAPGGWGVAGRVATLVEAAGAAHDVHVVVADAAARPGTNHGGLRHVTGAATMTRLALGAAGARVPGRHATHEISRQLGAVDARSVDGVLVAGLDLAPIGAAVAEWLGVALLVDAAGDHQGLLRPVRPSVASEPDWYLGSGCAARARAVLVTGEDEVAVVEGHLGAAHIAATVPLAAPQVAWQVGPPVRTGRVLVRGDFTTPTDLAAARWLVVEVLPLLPEPFTIELAGDAGPEVHHLVSRRPGARVLGRPADLLDAYHLADVAVAAQRLPGAGAGAVLEAFSHRRAVVATTAAVEGLAVQPGQQVRTAEEPDAFAGAIMALARPRTDEAERLVEAQVAAAAEVAATRHHHDTVRARAAEVLAAATGARQGTAA